MRKSLIDLVKDYGIEQYMNGYTSAQAESFEGDSQQPLLEKKSEIHYKESQLILKRIRKLLVGEE